MKLRRAIIFALSYACLAVAANKYSAITGVWQAQLDGLPALTMTISDEGGELTGAIVFYLIRRDEGKPSRSSPGSPEPLFNLKFDGKALNFRISHRRAHGPQNANDPPVNFRLEITGPNEGVLTRENRESIRVSRDRYS